MAWDLVRFLKSSGVYFQPKVLRRWYFTENSTQTGTRKPFKVWSFFFFSFFFFPSCFHLNSCLMQLQPHCDHSHTMQIPLAFFITQSVLNNPPKERKISLCLPFFFFLMMKQITRRKNHLTKLPFPL